jgi:hypothetical protein
VLPLHDGKKLAFRRTDCGYTTRVELLDGYCDDIFITQMSTSLCACCNGSHTRCHFVAAVTSGVSPFAVNGFAKPQHDDSMSTYLHMRGSECPPDANEAGSLSRGEDAIA